MAARRPGRSIPLKAGGHIETLRTAYPLIISTGSFTAMQFCDRMFLSWHSAEALQAALPAGILAFTMICFFTSLVSYANTFVAQYFGAGDREGCSRSLAQSVFLALISWPIILATIPAGRLFLRSAGHPPGVFELEWPYFWILMAGSLGPLLGIAASNFFTGRGQTLVTMTAHVAANGVNIALDYALIFGRWGFPEMGIRGAAIATVAAGCLTPAILGALIAAPRMRREYSTLRCFRWDGALMKRLLRFGTPSSVQMVLDLASFTLFVLLTGRIGPLALAASNIALSVNLVSFMPMIGMGIAAATLVGQYQGRGEPETAERCAWSALALGLVYVGSVVATFLLFPRFWIGLFADRGPDAVPMEAVFETARRLLVFVSIWGFADAAVIILAGALRGAGDTRFVMFFSVALAWGFFGLGTWLILGVFRAGLFAAWTCTAVYIVLLGTGFFIRFRSGRWKAIDLLGRGAPPEPVAPGGEGQGVV
jgi:multidrug resistance protein, MATE family